MSTPQAAAPGERPVARLLVVEDDERMLDFLRRAFESKGYAVQAAVDGAQALRLGLSDDFDLVVLDVMIPSPDGLEVLQSWRRAGRTMPVLLLTARDALMFRVDGLDRGADDYLTKPFAVVELFARAERLLARPGRLRPTVLRCGDLTLDPATQTVRRGETQVSLSPKEFALLHEFMRKPDRVLSRTDLLDHVWDFSYDGDSNVIDVYVGYLRDKVDRPFGTETIETVRGVGYRLHCSSPDHPKTFPTAEGER
jgi:two-component system, OmpR family, response regulator